MRFRGPTNVRLHKRQPLKPRPWSEDWRNPDMKVLRTWRAKNNWGFVVQETELLSPEDASKLHQESLDESQAPTWDRDKTYF